MSALYFKLPYWISNNGDGSASTRFCTTREEADKEDDEQTEGWGERCSDSVSLKVENNKLYLSSFESVDGKYQTIWKEVIG